MTDRHYEFSSRLIDFMMTVSGLDPFTANRGRRKKTASWNGWMRKHWPRVNMFASIYLVIRITTTVSLRLTLVQLEDGQGSENLTSKLNWILKLVGDPFHHRPNLMLLLYLFDPLVVIWFGCCQPVYLDRIQPFDCSLTRFVLEPEEEIRRFDLQACMILRETVEAIERQRREIAHNLTHERNDSTEMKALILNLNEIQRHISGLRRISIDRPETLGADWHKRMHKIIFIAIVNLSIVNILYSYFLTFYFTRTALIGRCHELNQLMPSEQDNRLASWPSCRLLDAFNFPDLLMATELTIIFWLLGCIPASVNFALQPLQVVHQLHLTNDISSRLREKLDKLRNFHHEVQLNANQRGLSDQLISELCADIISLRMFERGSRKCVATLALGARFATFVFLLFTSLIFSSLRLQVTQLSRLSNAGVDPLVALAADANLKQAEIVMVATWLMGVFQIVGVLLSCAMIPARITGIDRTVFSLMAQLIRIQQEGRSTDYTERLKVHDCRFAVDDPITSLWRRRVLNTSCYTDRSAVRLFNTHLTYNQVLAILFYAATIISLLYTYIR